MLKYKCKIAVVTTNVELIWLTSKHKINILNVGHFFVHTFVCWKGKKLQHISAEKTAEKFDFK
jgi:hypothetical protein